HRSSAGTKMNSRRAPQARTLFPSRLENMRSLRFFEPGERRRPSADVLAPIRAVLRSSSSGRKRATFDRPKAPPRRAAGALIGARRQLVVIGGDPKHTLFRRRIAHFVGQDAHLLASLPPVLGIVDEKSRRHDRPRKADHCPNPPPA